MGKGRSPCCDKNQVKRGPWSPTEDLKLINYIQKHGHENWRALPKQAGLLRCGKSCRLRWINYLRPDLKRGNFTQEEEDMIIKLHQSWGNRWSKIASQFPGRTDNEIKNVWNTHLKKRLARMEANPNANESIQKSVSISKSSNENVSRGDTNMATKQDDQKNRSATTTKPRVIKIEFDTSSNVAIPNYKIDVNNQGPNEMHNVVIKQEVEEMPIEIPLENDSDFWNMLDGISNSLESDNEVPELDNVEEIGNGYSKEIETKRWLQYLECELGLDEKPLGDQIEDLSGDANIDQSEIPENSPGDNSREPEADSKIGCPKNWP